MNKTTPPLIATLASGEGTTVEAFILASASGQITPQVGLVITNNKNAGVINRINRLNQQHNLAIPVICINGRTHPPSPGEVVSPGGQTKAEEMAILELLAQGDFAAIVLMGYMKKIGPNLVQAFGWRSDYTSSYQASMLNTHPGLLPATKGLYGSYVQQQVLDSGTPYAGQTLHVVAADYDDGPVIAEHKIKVIPGETADDLFERVKAVEKQHLPADVAQFIAERQTYLKQKEA